MHSIQIKLTDKQEDEIIKVSRMTVGIYNTAMRYLNDSTNMFGNKMTLKDLIETLDTSPMIGGDDTWMLKAEQDVCDNATELAYLQYNKENSTDISNKNNYEFRVLKKFIKITGDNSINIPGVDGDIQTDSDIGYIKNSDDHITILKNTQGSWVIEY